MPVEAFGTTKSLVWAWVLARFNTDQTKPEPEVVFDSDRLLKDAHGRHAPCSAYEPWSKVVVVPTHYWGESLEEQALLAHEFTHALGRGEAEAYAAQADYISTHGGNK